MSVNVIIGTQWGDEAKGKTIDILAAESDAVIRAQGGNNAGHTVVADGVTYKLNLIPSGILHKGTLCMLGAGMVIDPRVLIAEMEKLSSYGITFENLKIDPRAHVVMPWHIALDKLSESYKSGSGSSIGTTGRGIGPCYADKYERVGLRIYDIAHPEVLSIKAHAAGELKNRIITEIYGGEAIDIEAVIAEYKALGEKIAPFIDDVSVLAEKVIKDGKNLLLEGAQATLLDIDFGTYPYVTSSHPISAGVCTGAGVAPNVVEKVYGVAKAYTTRVGEGPFPTELLDETGDYIREKGQEFGTTTGRPRRTGWFDAVIVRHAVRLNGITDLVIGKLDTISGIETLKICTSYRKSDGTVLDYFPSVLEELADCTPIYEEFKGFDDDITACRSWEDLPAVCQDYILKLQKLCGCKVSMIGVGPDRVQQINI
jgi:adenylosuccinate synthase